MTGFPHIALSETCVTSNILVPLFIDKSCYIFALFLNCRYMIVNQLKLMGASPAFKVNQKPPGTCMLVKNNFDNQCV